jgi:PH (Pleckstrin Homology) domain-containing protein
VPPPALPVVWRPRLTRVVAYSLATVLVAGMVLLAIVVAPQFKLTDRVAMVLFGLAMAWLLHMLARCRVAADEQGITVVNAFRTRRLAWPEVVRVTMTEGEPWPTLDLADGTATGAMGINGAEKKLAARQLAELRTALARYGEAADR